jgi:hypothetical protein
MGSRKQFTPEFKREALQLRESVRGSRHNQRRRGSTESLEPGGEEVHTGPTSPHWQRDRCVLPS